MTFIAGFALGVLLTITFALLSVASDEDDYYEENLDE